MVNNCPINKKGCSTGRAPIQVSKKKIAMNHHQISFLRGDKENEILVLEDFRGMKYNTRTEISKAITPPNLLGIDRRIA